MKLEPIGRSNCGVGSGEAIGVRGVAEGTLGGLSSPSETIGPASVPGKLGMADSAEAMTKLRSGTSTFSLLERTSCDSDTITIEGRGRSPRDSEARLLNWMRGLGSEDCRISTLEVVGTGFWVLVGRESIV